MKPSKFDAIGVNVKVLREEDGEWHEGMVEEYNPRKGYHIQLFDGDDIWLAALGDDVQFEKELDLGDFEGAGEKTSQTEMSFHEDELEILKDADEVLGVDNVNQDYEVGLSVPDYQLHQEYNQRSIRADLPTLPPGGILLSGSVLGAAGLVIDEEEVLDGEVFFKVLFVEGGSQPAVFRCKTPIYTSVPVARTLSNPQWHEAHFQFDMIMPGDPATRSPLGFKIQGEIIIAVYMTRANGGNSLLGQASFQLKDLAETGTVEFFASGFEGRSVTGAQTILSRSGEISGEVDVQLNIAWKSLRPTTSGSQGSPGGLPPRRPVSASKAAATTTGTSSRKTAGGAGHGNKTIASGRSGSAPRRPASASATATNKGAIPAPRKIVSNIQRKQREDAARIAKENLKLAHTLQQHANRNGRSSTTAPTTAYAAPVSSAAATSAAPSASVAALKAQKFSTAADAKEAADHREFKATARAAALAKASSEAQVTESLVRIYTELKRATAVEEQELVKLKLKAGKLKVSVKQCEMSVARIRSDSTNPQSKGVGSGVASLRSSLRSSGEHSMGNNRRSHESLFQSDPKDIPPTSARRQAKDVPHTSNTGGSIVQKLGAHEYIPFFTPLTDEQLRAWGVQDGEYKSLAEEYNVLQAVRRGLLDRQRTAQLSCENASEKQLSAKERGDMIRRRVDYYRDIAGKLAIGINLHIEGMNANGGSKQASSVSHDEDSLLQSDYALFDRLRTGKQEYATDAAIYESGMHQIAQENAIEELRGVRDFLTKKCTECEQNVNKIKKENDLFHQQLRNTMERERDGESVDAYVRMLRAERSKSGKGVLRADVHSRLQQAKDATAAVDRQLREVQHRQDSRKSSRGNPDDLYELDG